MTVQPTRGQLRALAKDAWIDTWDPMSTDEYALTERIARALYENATYYGPESTQPPWESRSDEECGEWMNIATTVASIVADEVHKAKAEAWEECATKIEMQGTVQIPDNSYKEQE